MEELYSRSIDEAILIGSGPMTHWMLLPLKQEYSDGSVLVLIFKFVCVSICDCVVKLKFCVEINLSVL